MKPLPARPGERARGDSQHRRLRERALQHLASAFEAVGWSVSSSRKESPADLLCRRGNEVYAVDVKAVAGRARRPMLQAFLADAILRSRVLAREVEAKPLAILVASSVSDHIVAELEEYVSRFGGKTAWGILDDRGRLALHGPALSAVLPQQPVPLPKGRSAPLRAVRRAAHHPFTDLGQWMLKLLAAAEIPEAWLHAPRQPVRGVSDLATLAGVSFASASNFLAALRADGHVVQVEGALRLARVNELFEAWRVASAGPVEERLARFLLPTRNPAQRLREVLTARGQPKGKRAGGKPAIGSISLAGAPGKRVCMALFSACGELEVGFVRGAPVHLYAEDLSNESLERLELHPVENRADAELAVRRPRFPESVFRACVEVKGAAVADIVQCWLDVSFHPARGAEQAAEIAKRLPLMEPGL